MRLDVEAPYRASLAARPFIEQASFWRDPAREKIAFAGVRSGKTYGGAESSAARIVADVAGGLRDGVTWSPVGARPMVGRDHPRSLFWVVAPTYTLVRTAWTMLRAVLRRVEPLILHETDGAIWLRTGVLIERRTGRDEGQLQASSVAGVWIDEICTLPEDSWLQLRNRVSDREGWIIGTGSPRPGTWAREALWDRPRPGLSVHHWTSERNPHLPPGMLADARATLPERWYRRDYLADWSTYDGLVYDAYSDDAIVDDPTLSGAVVRLAVDFGRRRPAALLIADYGEIDVVVDELVMADVLEEQFYAELVQLCRRRSVVLDDVWADPAGTARNAQSGISSVDLLEHALREGGVLRGAIRWPRLPHERSIANGVGAVASRLRTADGLRRLFVARSLTEPERLRSYPRGVAGIHASLLGYVYPEGGKRGADDTPVKDSVHDHFADALRMYIVGHRGVGLERGVTGWSALDARVEPGPALPLAEPARPQQQRRRATMDAAPWDGDAPWDGAW